VSSAIESLPEGWLEEVEVRHLQALAVNRLVLEIGSWRGRSTVALAQAALHVVSVDHHKGSAEHESYGPSLPELVTNLDAYGVRDKVSVCVMDSSRLLRLFKPAVFDLVFVDGAHDFEAARRDANSAAGLVRSGGTIIFHDCSNGWPGVMAAVQWLLEAHRGWRMEAPAGSLAVIHAV
jgi:predicted O-methyltransferase YrrM